MNDSVLEVAVIGAGQAGLAMSYNLQQRGLRHLVFEKGKIGNSWATQRWDSFQFNTPNKINMLPGIENDFSDPDGFCTAEDFVAYLQNYVDALDLPVLENTEVLSVGKASGSDLFSITVVQAGTEKTYQSKKVVVASGIQNLEVVPDFANDLSPEVVQMHASEYRNADKLPGGAVLVVGSGQSGVQIAEDLLEAGRKVFLSTSMVARGPRRYRGRDIMDWMGLIGFNNHRPEDLADPQMMKMKQPHISGVGPRGRTVSLQSLAGQGAVILGKIKSVQGHHIDLEPNAAAHVKFGDTFSKKIKEMVDGFIAQTGLDAPPPEADPADVPDEDAACACHDTALDLKEQNITTVIWATGFVGDFNYIRLPVFNEDKSLKHQQGIGDVEGLYFLGFPWLRKRKSGIVLGIEEDAKFICDAIE